MAAAMQPRWAVRKTIVSSVGIGLIDRPSGRFCFVLRSADASLFISFWQIAIDCKRKQKNKSSGHNQGRMQNANGCN
jgi:hypothetical protein